MERGQDAIEELTPIREIQPLPIEPQEQGLEYLPMADDQHEMQMSGSQVPTLLEADRQIMSFGSKEEANRPAEEPREPEADQIEEMEELEELQDTGELEEEVAVPVEGAEEEKVEELEPELLGEEWSEKDQEAELDHLTSEGKLQTLDLDEIRRIVEEGKSAIVMEDGVFRIKEDIYTARAIKAKEGKLAEIADAVIRSEKKAEEAAYESSVSKDEASGIGDLFQDAELVDLSPTVDGQRGEEEGRLTLLEDEKKATLQFKKNGIDYDGFLGLFPKSYTYTAQVKSLVEITRRASAVSGAIFVLKDGNVVPEITIGLSESSAKIFLLKETEPFVVRYMKTRLGVVIQKTFLEMHTFEGKTDPQDSRFIKRSVFLPVQFHGQDAYLFLAFTADSDIRLGEILANIRIE